jgi:malate dehydrogenase
MLSRIGRICQRQAGNVAVLGANGGIGQPLSLLMKQNTQVKQLNLFDIVGTPGVAADLSHCDTAPNVAGFQGPNQLGDCLNGMDLVIIPAGVPRKPGMTRDDLFNTNASIVAGLAEACAKHCPNAWLGIISNPVNSTVPIAVEVYKKLGVEYNKIFGVTTLDIVRAQAFVAEKNGSDPAQQQVPVIGGHAGITIIPVLSKANPALNLPTADIEALTARIQDAGTEVVKAKDGAGSATLSMAFAAARFADNCLSAQAGNDVTEYAYIPSDVTDSTYFSSKLTLNASGVAINHGLGEINAYEQQLVDAAVPELMKTVTKGEQFAASHFAAKAESN